MSPFQILALSTLVVLAFAEKRRAMPTSAQMPAQPKKEVPEIIDSRVRMQPPGDEASGRTSHLRQHVAELNSVLFAGNALQSMGGGSEQWIVAFCPNWWEPCKQLDVILAETAAAMQSVNTADFTSKIRFAKVDCAKEKVLCNQENVETYPTIAHYKGGRQIQKKVLSTKKLKIGLQSFVDESLKSFEAQAAQEDSSYLQLGGLCDVVVLLVAVAVSLRLAKSSPDLQSSESKKPPDKARMPKTETETGRLPQEWAHRSSINL